MAAVQFDIGLLVTALAALLAFGRGWHSEKGRAGWLRQTLLVAWAMAAVAILAEQPMSTIVFLTTMMDLFIAGVALVISTSDPTRVDARIVGAISMALMPAHWIVTMAQGLSDQAWMVYAATCNGAFVVQCLITGGWLDGVGRGISRFLGRFRPLSLLRFRRR